MTTLLIISAIFLISGAICFYNAYDKNRTYKQSRFMDDLQLRQMTDSYNNMIAREGNIIQQEQVVKKILGTNQEILKSNQKYVYDIKESTITIYDIRKKLDQDLDRALNGNMDYKSVHDLYVENKAQLDWINDYFTRTFKVTPDHYRDLRKNIIGRSQNGDDMKPWVTQHSVN